jgi:hypothetical protein
MGGAVGTKPRLKSRTSQRRCKARRLVYQGDKEYSKTLHHRQDCLTTHVIVVLSSGERIMVWQVAGFATLQRHQLETKMRLCPLAKNCWSAGPTGAQDPPPPGCWMLGLELVRGFLCPSGAGEGRRTLPALCHVVSCGVATGRLLFSRSARAVRPLLDPLAGAQDWRQPARSVVDNNPFLDSP